MDALDMRTLSPAQRRILTILADRQPHHADELVRSTGDSQATRGTIAPQLTALRKFLFKQGLALLTTRLSGDVKYVIVKTTEV